MIKRFTSREDMFEVAYRISKDSDYAKEYARYERDEYEDYSVDAVGSLSSPDEQYFTVRVSCGNKEKRIEIPTLRS